MAPLTLAKKLTRSPLFVTCTLFIVLVVMLNPSGEFAVNDDWLYTRNVISFSWGDYSINSQTDASIFFHILMGHWWVKLFGYSMTNLRWLTIFQTVLLFVGIDQIVKLFTDSTKRRYFVLLISLANPLLFVSAFSFMSEISFLLLLIWASYFVLKGKTLSDSYRANATYIFLGSILFGLAIWIRQVGIVGHIAIIAALVLSLHRRTDKKTFIINLISVSIVAYFFTYVWASWPRYTQEGYEGGLSDLLSKLAGPDLFISKLQMTLFMVLYAGYFFLPYSINELALYFVKKRALFLVLISLAIPLGWYIYNLDVFPVGNVFYIEALYAKSNFKSNLHAFDNIAFKLGLSYLIGVSLITTLKRLFGKSLVSYVRSKDFNFAFLFLMALGTTLLIFLGNDLYDRYYLPTFIYLTIMLGVFVKEVHVGMLFNLTTIAMCAISFSLLFEYFSHTRLRWEFARNLQQETGKINGIHVDGIYARYYYADKHDDYTGLLGSTPTGQNYTCYVDNFTIDTDSPVLAKLEFIDEYLQKYIDKKKIYGYKKPIVKLSSAKKNLDDMSYIQEYPSIIYNLVGKKAFVGGWCLDEDE